jgi:tetratricopeptide (TPR) repeat protein
MTPRDSSHSAVRFPFRRGGVLRVALALSICLRAASVVHAAEAATLEPCADTAAEADQTYTGGPRNERLGAWLGPAATLRLDILTETVAAGAPFRVILRAYDRHGLPFGSFSEPVTFECASGVVPIHSSARWLNGVLEETVIIARSGRNVRLSAVTHATVAAVHLDVAGPPGDKAMWLRVAEEDLRRGRIEDGIFALKRASSLERLGDPAIERRIAKLYMERGRWREADEHYRRAIRAVAVQAQAQ